MGTDSRRIVLFAALALIVCVVLSPSGLAQFRSGVQMVPLTVTVTDAAGRYVPGLTANDFTIFEEKERQSVSYFGALDSPVDIALLLDTSTSMVRDLPFARQAACGLVRRLKPDDRTAVAGISSNMNQVQPMTPDRNAVEEAIRSLKAAGATALYEGIYIALREFERGRDAASGMKRQVMVVLSDGIDTASRIEFEDVLELVRRGHVAVYVVLLESDPRQTLASTDVAVGEASFRMHALARESGGRVFTPRSGSDLPAMYTAIADELGAQYLLGYTPTRQDSDGGFRRISVRVRHPDVLQARTRAGYFALAQRRTSVAARAGHSDTRRER